MQPVTRPVGAIGYSFLRGRRQCCMNCFRPAPTGKRPVANNSNGQEQSARSFESAG
jgi:hypothetical protein